MTIYSHILWNVVAATGRSWRWAFALGAVIPDLPYIALLVVARMSGESSTNFDWWDWAWSHPVTVAAHAYPPVVLVLLLSWWWGSSRSIPWLWGWLTHVAIDMLTHVTDAYPVLWPFSDWTFPTLVSYWDPRYYGREFSLINNLALLAALIWLAWRRVRGGRKCQALVRRAGG